MSWKDWRRKRRKRMFGDMFIRISTEMSVERYFHLEDEFEKECGAKVVIFRHPGFENGWCYAVVRLVRSTDDTCYSRLLKYLKWNPEIEMVMIE